MKIAAYILRLLALALAFVLAAKAGQLVPVGNARVSPMWPPAGLTLVVLTLAGPRYAPGVWLGSFMTARLGGLHTPLSSLLATAGTIEALTGAWLLRRLAVDRRLARVRDVLAFVGSAVVTSALGAMMGVGLLAAWGRLRWAAAPGSAAVWCVGDAMGMMMIAPVVFTLRARSPRALQRPHLEAVAVAVLFALTCAIVFSGRPALGSATHSPAFLVFPCAMWAALRFGPRGAAIAAAATSVVAIVTTSLGYGPFALGKRVDDVLLLQLFMSTVYLTVLLLAAATAERAEATGQVALLAAAVRASGEAVLITDLERPPAGPRILFTNDAVSRLTGYDEAEMLDKTPALLLGRGPSATHEWPRIEEALVAAQPFQGEMVILRRDGAEVEIDVHVSPVQEDGDAPEHMVVTCRDVTERNRIRTKLALAERMATVGTLAAGVGHEINTPLAFIIANLEGLSRRLAALVLPEGTADLDALQQSVRDSLEGAARIRTIVRDLKTLSRDGDGERSLVDLAKVMTVALNMASGDIGRRAKLVTDLGASPPVYASEGRMGQVLLNLVVNAMQSMSAAPGENVLRVRTGTAPDGRALVEVEDTGGGIPSAVLPRIFEPFFTTKGPGGGTGLGLSICHQIVSASGGEIMVDSTEGKGTTVRVLLPAATGEVVTTPSPVPASFGPAVPTQRGRVLVVDDEIRFARSVRWLLEPEHEVEVTADGAEALDWIARGPAFDVILCDLQMPGLSGMEIHAKLTATSPEEAKKMVFVSGGAVTAEAREFVRVVKNPVLDKPFRPEALQAIVAEVLAANSDRAAE